MGAEDGAHSYRVTGALELDRPVHPVGVGAGECSEAVLRRGLGQRLGTGCSETEGEMRVGVEVGEHFYKQRERGMKSVSGLTSVSGERDISLNEVTATAYAVFRFILRSRFVIRGTHPVDD